MEQLLLEFVNTLDVSLKRLHRELSAEAGFADLTISQLEYIDAIQTLGAPNITEIAEQLHISKASTTVAVNKLIKLGFVQKTRSTVDRRVYLVTLTPAGERLTAAKHRALKMYGDFIRATLTTAEAGQFAHILSKLVSQFNPDSAKTLYGDKR